MVINSQTFRTTNSKGSKKSVAKSSNVMSNKDFNGLNSNSTASKKNKYNAKKKRIDGHLFDSTLEANRYLELRDLLKLGQIKKLDIHVKYPLTVNDILVATYEADFVYITKDDETVVEDTKGFLTKEYVIKRNLMLAVYGIKINEVYAKPKRKKNW